MFDLDDDILIIIDHEVINAFFVVVDPALFSEEIFVIHNHVVFLGIFEEIITHFNLLYEFKTVE